MHRCARRMIMMSLLPPWYGVALKAQDASRAALSYAGAAHVGQTVWEFAVTVGRDSVWITVPSLWIPRTAIARMPGAESLVTFRFPWNLGTLSWRESDSSRVIGTFVTDSGLRGKVMLERRASRGLVTQDVTVEHGGVLIAGTASSRAAQVGRRPAVVILHGGGNSSRADSPPYRYWGEYFAQRGMVALTYDKRGNGQSTGDWREVGFEERAADVDALLAWLRSHPDVDPGRVGLFAVSQGSWVANLVAARDTTLAFLIQVSGPAVTPYEADTHAATVAWRRLGLNRTELSAARSLWALEVEAIRLLPKSPAWERYRDAGAAAARQPWFARAQYGMTEPTDWFARWYRKVAGSDPAASVPTIRAPMLWLYGSHDTQSDVRENVRRLKVMRQKWALDLTVVTVPNADHGVLAPVDRLGRPVGSLAVPLSFFAAMERWLDRNGYVAIP